MQLYFILFNLVAFFAITFNIIYTTARLCHLILLLYITFSRRLLKNIERRNSRSLGRFARVVDRDVQKVGVSATA